MVDVQITAEIVNLEQLRAQIAALGNTPVKLTLDAAGSLSKIAGDIQKQMATAGIGAGAAFGKNIASGISSGATKGAFSLKKDLNFEVIGSQTQAKIKSAMSKINKASTMDDSAVKAAAARAQQSMQKAQIEYNRMKMLPNAATKASADNAMKTMAADLSMLTTAMGDYGRAAGEANKAAKEVFNTQKIGQKANEMSSYMDTLRSKWSKLFKKSPEMAAQFEEIQSAFKGIASAPEGMGSSLDAATSKLNTFSNTAKAAGLATQSWGDSFKGAFASISQYFGAAQVWSMVKNGVRDMVGNVKEIDTAMTDLRKVSDGSNATYDAYLKNAGKRASDMSTSLSGYIEGTTGFARMGYGLKDAQQLGEVANIYYNVADGVESIGDATNSVISTMRAFNLQANDAMSIADKANKLGNEFAVSSGGLGTVLQGSAAAMAAAGNDLDQSLAMATGMMEVNQNAGNTAATLKVAALRIRGASKALEEMGEETDTVVTSQSKMRDEIKLLTDGFDIMKDDDSYKGFFEQMRGVAEAYNEMDPSSTKAARLLELISGKSRSSNMAGMLRNWEQVEKAYKASMNSDGSAMKEYSTWQKSLEAKSKKLEASAQRASQAFLGNGPVGATYDVLTGIVDGFSNIAESVGGFTAAMTALSPVLTKFFPQLGIAYVQYAPLREIPVAA